jgi:inosine-uridine nucleoside N-ribohydrolase
MKKIIMAAILAPVMAYAQPVKIIFDTDMLTDFDDVGALASLHALADAGEAEILATVSSTRGNASVGAVQVINSYYGRGDLPVGAPKGMGVFGAYPGAKEKVDPKSPLEEKSGGDGGHYKYRKLLKDYPNSYTYADADDAPDANDVYRSILASQPDGSVVICSVGFMTNLRRLLESKGDSHSPLDGKELVKRKVKLWVAMACKYFRGVEYNSSCDAESSRIAFDNWPTPIVFVDWDLGVDIFAGRAIAEKKGPRNPVKDVFAGNIPSRAQIKGNPSRYLSGCYGMGGRSAWDEVAVLVAVRGWEEYFNANYGRYRMVGKDGVNEWSPIEGGPHIRLSEKMPKLQVGKIIDELICRAPCMKVVSPGHRARLDAEDDIIGIVHWGLNTYTDREWGFGDEDPSMLNPSKFDADKIIGACKDGGIRGLVVVAKHHDGFCLWPTKTTSHNITRSPFRGGKGDYVREMEQACRRAGLKFGVYISPWDRNSAHYATDKYVEIYHEQIKELLNGSYGEVFEMWFDGANGGDGWYGGANEKRSIPKGYYRFNEVFAFVRALQPKVTIFSGQPSAEYRWPYNECGDVDPILDASRGGYFGQWEADFPMRPGWFYHAKERGKTKHAAYLMNRYLSSVGNGGTMNIGIAPNKDGLLDEEDVKALKGFKVLKDAFFSRPVKDGGNFNFVKTKDKYGVTRLYFTTDVNVRGERFLVDKELIDLVRNATTESGETDTAKWMTGVEKERK